MALTNAEYQAATRAASNAGPRPLSQRCDRRSKKIAVALDTGSTSPSGPNTPRASPEDLAAVTVSPLGLQWEKLDADLSIAGLLAGRLGSARWMASLMGAKAGRARSPAKAAAARAEAAVRAIGLRTRP
ncbi:MAG: DUF2442 domain-containing protein [Phreatobacter sp.]